MLSLLLVASFQPSPALPLPLRLPLRLLLLLLLLRLLHYYRYHRYTTTTHYYKCHRYTTTTIAIQRAIRIASGSARPGLPRPGGLEWGTAAKVLVSSVSCLQSLALQLAGLYCHNMKTGLRIGPDSLQVYTLSCCTLHAKHPTMPAESQALEHGLSIGITPMTECTNEGLLPLLARPLDDLLRLCPHASIILSQLARSSPIASGGFCS